jgi:hypothetical protein
MRLLYKHERMKKQHDYYESLTELKQNEAGKLLQLLPISALRAL